MEVTTATLMDLVGKSESFGETQFLLGDSVAGFDLSSVDYGDISNSPSSYYGSRPCVRPALLSYSDYSGCSVERANHRAFAEQFKDHEETVWLRAYGGYGTEAIVILLDSPVDSELRDEIQEFFEGLDNYPCADEEIMGEVETEAQDEAWSSWVESDFRSGLIKEFPESEDAIDEMDSDALFSIFRDACESANEYWIIETGGNAWIRLERVIPCAVIPEA